jgi:hypothetical protein
MVEDLKKMQTSWPEMEDFGHFSKLLLTMNPMQKKLKEGMATSFLRKMATQVRKHNKQIPYDKASRQICLWGKGNWPGCCSSAESRQQRNVCNIKALLFGRAQSRD